MQEVSASIVRLPAAHDSLNEILCQGAQQLLAQVIEAEVTEWIDEHQHVKDRQGRRQVVRNGYLPERKLVTPVGELVVQQPAVAAIPPQDQEHRRVASLDLLEAAFA